MVLDAIKKILKGDETTTKLKSGPVSIEDYVEVPVQIHEENNIIKIKVCELEDYRDAREIVLLIEAGYLVIADTINLERDMDEDYAKLLAYLKDKLSECGGNMVRVGDEKILVIPSNVIIEKLVKEPETKEETPTISEPMEEYNEEDENQQ
jgi:SepF-like predicted cell division protein (DUF552 family)